MKKLLFTNLAICLMLLTACTKEDLDKLDFSGWGGGGGIGPITLNGSGFPSETRGFFILPLSRYYIYRDEATGATDSMLIEKSMDSLAFQPASTNYPIGYYNTSYVLKINRYNAGSIETWFNGTATTDFPTGMGTTPTWIVDDKFYMSDAVTQSLPYWQPLNSTGSSQYQYFPSMALEGNTYSGVHQFTGTNGLMATDPNYRSTSFWWVSNIGIIKRQVRIGQAVTTTNLVRYGSR